MTGRLQRNIAVFAAVEPFIIVTAQNRRGENYDDDDEAVKSRGGKENAGKEKRRNLASLEPEDSESHKPLEGSNKPSSSTATVFVVRRISSFLSGGEHHVVFSVLG